jgi:DNA replication protein DnaC
VSEQTLRGIARAGGSLRRLLVRLSRIDVLIIDDWGMAPLSETERRDVWEICEDRYQARSTLLTSQLPVSRWYEQIGDPTIADGILDRLVSQCPSYRDARRIHAQETQSSVRRQSGKRREAKIVANGRDLTSDPLLWEPVKGCHPLTTPV